MIRATSSANLRSVSFSPSILTPLASKGSSLNTLYIADVNILGDKVSPCLTPLSIFTISDTSLSRWILAVAFVPILFDVKSHSSLAAVFISSYVQ